MIDLKLIKRFMGKISQSRNCWEWIGTIHSNGYGKFPVSGNYNLAHRISYELFKGEIPEGLQLDHLCRNRKCVNPDHLEAVTCAENIKRGLTGKINNHEKLKICCIKGHEFSKNNTRIGTNGQRICKQCHYVNNKISRNRIKLREVN